MPLTCPHCKAAIDAPPDTARAPATCPHCNRALDAPGNTTETTAGTIPKPAGNPPPAAPAAATGPAPANDPAADPAPPGDKPSATRQPDQTAANPPTANARHATPGFLQQRRANPLPRRKHLLAWGAIVALTLLLGLQVLLADRARLAQDPDWRPILATLCSTLGCSVPAWHEPAAFTMLQRGVRSHPDVPGALRISASFRNDARWPQAWPGLSLTLSDINGQTIGARTFTAGDYLDDTAKTTRIAPGQTATIVFDIREPAADVVAFTFAFR